MTGWAREKSTTDIAGEKTRKDGSLEIRKTKIIMGVIRRRDHDYMIYLNSVVITNH